MKPIRTKAVVLRRTNYGEADRILQMLTPDNGKIAVMAKGVRREKSKLAGAVELFAISDVTVVPGKGDIWTLAGAKMDTFFAHIMADYERMQFAYEAIKQVSKATEQVSDPSYYTLLTTALASLDDSDISLDITSSWFWLQLAILEGQGLNLSTDVNGMKLVEDQNYTFDVESMSFAFRENGEFTTEHIKLLRILSAQSPVVVSKVKGVTPLLTQIRWLAERALAH
jgi:DNA repair protein RecO (recombination protein O)